MDLDKLAASLREMGFTDTDEEYKRLMAAATPVTEEDAVTEDKTETRATEVTVNATADAVDEAAAVRVSQVAAEVDAGELRTLLNDARQEIGELNERIGGLDSFRVNFEARYGVLTSDEDEANARAGEVEADKPLASEEEFTEANNYELTVGLFREIMSRWTGRHGDAPTPEGVIPTARALAHIRRLQGTALAGEAPAYR